MAQKHEHRFSLDKIIAQEDYIFRSCSRILYPTNLFDKENNDFY